MSQHAQVGGVPKSAPPPPWRVDLGTKVRNLRTARDWSQEQLAEHAAIHATYVSGIERGRRNVSIDILYRLADAFDVEIRDLF